MSHRDTWVRPKSDDISLFSDPLLSLANLKALAAGPGLGHAGDDGGIILRSVYWRFYHGLLPPPTSLDLFPPALVAARRDYDELRKRYLIAPDGRWAADCSGGDGYEPSSGSGEVFDPLSTEDDSPWKAWFAHLELRATIRQDVDRTFPDMPYFQDEGVRRSLTTMLFLFAVLNPDVGYRQVIDRDSLVNDMPPRSPRPSSVVNMDEALATTLDRVYVEHDAFALFQEIMRSAKAFYEWRTEEGPVIVAADYPVVLTNLLHYPSPSPSYPFNPGLILQQAQRLRDDTSAASGVEVMLQNQELLGVRAGGSSTVDLSEPPASPGYSFFGRNTPSPGPNGRARARAGVQSLAQGLFERAQKAGLDKAILSTVTDLRNSLPDTSSYSFFSPANTDSGKASPYSTIPSSTAPLPPRPTITPHPSSDAESVRSLLNADRQMAEVRLAMVGMGKAMAEWLELVRSGDGSPDEIAHAYKGLDRVRDSLLGAAGCDVEDLVRDWTWNEGLDTHKAKSNSNTQTPLGSPRHRPQTDTAPIPGALLPKRGDSKPLPPEPPSARAESPEPAIIEEGLGAMGLSETKTKPPPPPVATLPTAPAVHQPTTRPQQLFPVCLSPRTHPHIQHLPSKCHPGPHRRRQCRRQSSATHSPSPPLDPLGGLGVSESAKVERRRSGIRMRPTSSSSGFSAVEVGVDPLGAGV
ncbi:hypothetical protein A1Q1_03383 [Trichosporon asahii var. asahii CBS 2479]|uniref:Rab-GAP TBC domain-containing protein n=1 Tax=Trichosporon asahii var. asahii (strain ATCC 90039 / CBS 2479 / JCM 2466 / KCTC 7840 / NBRC 103889/ NCYC 2677 / UAMH 7654) TaxID=1186058 RepID=J5TSR0_TRIAS|nr:hypothetical protein A1Q1_03383 [Trichosporon asahii var. asahii CBS 2479]EJT52581.1 hypothetical protein A1Q1_03383 [Trichosporon asahii var. asahii CBS 2479]